nr:hypothetical protein [Tanacetum cinerariifolium]
GAEGPGQWRAELAGAAEKGGSGGAVRRHAAAFQRHIRRHCRESGWRQVMAGGRARETRAVDRASGQGRLGL